MSRSLWWTVSLVLAGCAKDGRESAGTGSLVGVPGGTPVGAPGGTPAGTTPPVVHENLLILSIDTLRRDHLGRYDAQGRALMPFLDQLMAEGVVADAYHPGSNWTYHAFSTELSGRYPIDEGVLPRVDAANHGGWPEGSRFLADELHDAGFTTIMSSANGWLKPQYGLGGSYDVYLGEAFQPADTVYGFGTDALQDQLDAGSVDRWYLHIHFLEPHAPFVPPVEYRVGEELLDPLPWNIDTQGDHYAVLADWPAMTPDEQALLQAHLQVRYEGELRWLDDRLAAFWQDLDDRGWLDDTLVLVFSDHGEQFWERGYQSHAYHLFAEETNGVFFAWSKALAPAAFAGRVSGVDVGPTALSWLGLDPPASWVGAPITALPADRPVFADSNARLGVVQSVTLGDRALVYRWVGEASFHHLDTDPAMLDDRYDPTDPEVVALWELLRPRIQESIPLALFQTPLPPPGLSL